MSSDFVQPKALARANFPRQKDAGKSVRYIALNLEKFGAGEGIRTLDPNLGKVVLYP